MLSKRSKKMVPAILGVTLAASTLLSAGQAEAIDTVQAVSVETKKIKNIIFLIGDGMGTPYTTAYRYMKDDPSTPLMEKTEFDPYLVGAQMTYPEDEHQNVTDSASAATAMSAGVKTYNAAIAVDNDQSEVKTVLEQAKENGKATGLIATSEITHATPAAFGAHDISRKNMDAIADDYFDELVNGKHKVDVLLGGGKTNFVRENRDLTKEFQGAGFSYVTDRAALLKDTNNQILGLFADGGLDKAIDRASDTPSLAEMTTTAIDRLNTNESGFFLMVEGSQIDWAGHDNDIVGSMSEMEDFAKAFQAAIDFAKEDGETLVVATADHSTGGLTLGKDGEYNFLADPIKAAKRTPDFMAQEIADGSAVTDTLTKYINLELTAEEIQSVQDAAKEKNVTDIDNAIEKIFDDRSFTGWTTGGHTGDDVPVYAYGPGKDRFAGLIDNTDNARIIFDILSKHK